MLSLALLPVATVQVDVLGHGVIRSARRGELVGMDDDRSPPKVDVAARVVDMQVAVDDDVDLARLDTDLRESLPDRLASEAHLPEVVLWNVLADARVDQHRRLGMAN